MSLPSSWRQFQLFDFVPIKDPSYGTNDPLYSDPSLSAMTASSAYLVVCSITSMIRIIDENLTSLMTFQAYSLDYSINFADCLPNSNLLITLAERQGSPGVLKLWDLNKLLKLNGSDVKDEDYQHKFHTQVQIHNGDNSYPISCYKFNKSLSCIAVGFTNGKVLLIRGDLLRDRGSKQRYVYESNEPITGVQFNEEQDILYITTTSKILTVLTNGRNQGKPHRILSKSSGVDLNCSDVDPSNDNLIIGNHDSIRYYNNISKDHTINFEFPKKRIKKIWKNYLLVISSFDELINNTKKLITKIIILDLFNKHISFTLTIPNNYITNLFEWKNDVYLLTKDGNLYKIHEKAVNQQIEIVLQRELFTIAYQLATQSKLDSKILLRIEKLHANFLYDKQSYEDSIKSFISCLSLFDSSDTLYESDDNINDFIMDVITKFKDVSNIDYLTLFLYELYRLKLANNDHLTLLLCCYCKLKMIDELDSFIDDLNFDVRESEEIPTQKDTKDANFSPHDLNFQLIINLFRECRYFKQVIKLLFKLNQPNLIVEIQLNDLNQPQKVLQYLKTLPIDDLLLILIDYLESLLDVSPIETTQLLIEVFTGAYKPKQSESLFDDIETQPPTPPSTSDSIVLNSYQAFLSYIASSSPEDDEKSVEHSEPTYLPPRPKLIFSKFLNNPKEFVIFLEACIETFDKYQGKLADKKDLLITLFEMYLSIGSTSTDSERENWLNKARALINDYASLLDKSSLLLISHIYDLAEGEILAKEGSGNFEEGLFRSAAMSKNLSRCLEVVDKYGKINPNLFKMLLKLIVSLKFFYSQLKEADIKKLISKIKDLKLMSPLELVTLLGANDFVTIGLLKDYLIEYIDVQNKEISNNMKLIQSYELESTKNSHKLTELVKKPFMIQNNKCSHCQLRLDFPVIHFKCKHSYHQRCLNENNYISESTPPSSMDVADVKRCPLCIGELDAIQTIRMNQLSSKDNYQLFETQLNDSSDRFKVVSDYLGKGVMENDSILLK